MGKTKTDETEQVESVVTWRATAIRAFEAARTVPESATPQMAEIVEMQSLYLGSIAASLIAIAERLDTPSDVDADHRRAR